LAILKALLNRPSPLRHCDEVGVFAVFLSGLLDALDQIDDLGPLASLLLDQLDCVFIDFKEAGNRLKVGDADVLLNKLVRFLLESLIDVDSLRVGLGDDGVDSGERRIRIDVGPARTHRAR
jgi:hypothetical protein